MAVKAPAPRRPFGNLEDVVLNTFGHSWVQGPYGGPLGKRLYGRHNMTSYTSKGAGGTTAGQMAAQVQTIIGNGSNYPQGIASYAGLAVCCSMINDAFGSVASSTVVEAYRSTFAQLWGQFIAYTTSQFAFSSGWASGVTTTTGSYFDFSWFGDTGYILCSFQSGAAINLSITNSGTGNTVAQTPNIGGFAYTFPGVIKLGGYGPGKHTVRVTLTSGAGMTLYGGLFANPYPPQVLWVQEGATGNLTAPQNVLMATTYPAAVAPILSDFPNVTVIPVDSGWNSSQMLWSDVTHPNSKGITYLTDRMEEAVRKLGYVAGMSPMLAGPTANYGTTSIFPAVNYITGTLPTATYSNFKMLNTTANFLYAQTPDTDFPSSISYLGATVKITGGSGWTPGAYTVTQQFNASGTQDGSRTLLYVVPCAPLFLPNGVAGAAPAATSAAGGTGVLVG